MKTPRVGQVCTINNVVYRAYPRIRGCAGCDLDSFLTCPNITDMRTSKSAPLMCRCNGIILKRIK